MTEPAEAADVLDSLAAAGLIEPGKAYAGLVLKRGRPIMLSHPRLALSWTDLGRTACPVGLAEIAQRLDVARQTAKGWRLVAGLLPPPRWVVSGSPAWDWPDIEAWAEATGRLRPG